MQSFIIQPVNGFLGRNIQAYYNADFHGYKKINNPDFLNVLKNDEHQNWTDFQLTNAARQVRNRLLLDLPNVLKSVDLKSLTVCVIPRAKAENTYRDNQLLFKKTVREVVKEIDGFVDGTDYIFRHTNTKTTHLRREMEGYINDGPDPYPGITNNTCNISENVAGRDILLIDDIYTRTVNIDEDAIQALLNNGAKSVTFYAIGKTYYESVSKV